MPMHPVDNNMRTMRRAFVPTILIGDHVRVKDAPNRDRYDYRQARALGNTFVVDAIWGHGYSCVGRYCGSGYYPNHVEVIE